MSPKRENTFSFDQSIVIWKIRLVIILMSDITRPMFLNSLQAEICESECCCKQGRIICQVTYLIGIKNEKSYEILNVIHKLLSLLLPSRSAQAFY